MSAAAESSISIIQVVSLLGAAVVAVPLFKRLGLGSVLGYLAAGLAIGPFGLGLFHDGHTILHVAELGVVIFLFVIGLEMKPSHLWHLRKQIFGLGSMQVVLAAILLTIVGMLFGFSWQISFIGAAGFVLTSTAIVMSVLGERNELDSASGQKMVSILLFEDLLIVPLLAIVAFLSPVHTFKLFDADQIVRETFDSSIRVGKRALEMLGIPHDMAGKAGNLFYRMDRNDMGKMAVLYNPEMHAFENQAMLQEGLRQDARIAEAMQALLRGDEEIDESV